MIYKHELEQWKREQEQNSRPVGDELWWARCQSLIAALEERDALLRDIREAMRAMGGGRGVDWIEQRIEAALGEEPDAHP